MKKVNQLLAPLIIIAIIIFLVIGSQDAKDINEKYIFTAIAVDKKDGEIYMYAEVANIRRSNQNITTKAGTQNKYIYIVGHGKTLAEARKNLDTKLSKEPYSSAIRTIILTENYAKDSLVEYLYRIRSDESYRKKVITVITKDDPVTLFETINSQDESVGFSAEETLTSLDETYGSFSRTTMRMIENISSRYSGFLIPTIGIDDSKIALVGYSVINGTTIGGFIPETNSESVVYLKANKALFAFIIKYKDINFDINVSLTGRDIKTSYINNDINFDVAFSFKADIMYGDKKTPYNLNDSDREALKKLLSKKLKEGLDEAIRQAQEDFKCDYLQFDDEFRINYPDVFAKLDWEEAFQKANINVTVKLEIDDTWMMDYGVNTEE
ncbi:MAG: Ger(x)C family spore germination C-terminal domain-containing protein [Bacilli bacterium]|jgi:spore germination protein KC